MKHHRIATILVAFVLPATGVSQAHEVGPICGLAVHEEINERDALALGVELGKTELVAAQEVFELLEALWADEATERMRFLSAKYNRDLAQVELALRQAGQARQEAYLVWLEDSCSRTGRNPSGEVSEERQLVLDRYFAADCEVRRRGVDHAEVEHEWAGIWLASIRDLREHNVATRPELIVAEYDLRIAEQRVNDAVARVALCEGTQPALD